MAWYDNIVETTKGNVQGLVNALRNPQDIVKQGALYKNRDALAALLRGDTASIMAKLNEKSPANPMEALDAAMMLGTINPVGKIFPKTEFELAHELAQQRAALPVSEGGLGLHPQNTAMDRANSMGYTTPAYHGTESDILEFNLKKSRRGKGISVAETPENANMYARDTAIYPLLTNTKNVLDVNNPQQLNLLSKEIDNYYESMKPYDNKISFYPFTKENVIKGLQDKNSAYYSEMPLTENLTKKLGFSGIKSLENNMPQYKMYNPADIRSINAAFDPFRRNETDILAGVGALPFIDYSKDKNKK